MKLHIKWHGAVVVALSLAVMASVVPAAQADSCPSMRFFGVRGSGETNTSVGAGYGLVVSTVDSNFLLRAARAGIVMQDSFIDYPSVGFPDFLDSSKYEASLVEGTFTLYHSITDFVNSSCGKTTGIYLAGYSQGANVIDDVLEMLKHSPSVEARIRGVVLFGDPRFNPSETSVDQGSYDSRHGGIAGSSNITGTGEGLIHYTTFERSIVSSYCMKGDEVCNTKDVANLRKCVIDCPHEDYWKQTATFGRPKVSYMDSSLAFLWSRYQRFAACATKIVINVGIACVDLGETRMLVLEALGEPSACYVPGSLDTPWTDSQPWGSGPETCMAAATVWDWLPFIHGPSRAMQFDVPTTHPKGVGTMYTQSPNEYTNKGIHVGSTLAEVQRAYPKAQCSSGTGGTFCRIDAPGSWTMFWGDPVGEIDIDARPL